jgi:hypothetical protein
VDHGALPGELEDRIRRDKMFQTDPLKIQYHQTICDGLTPLYVKKNTDYQDSFAKGIEEYGPSNALGRMSDKLSRAKALLSGAAQQVSDESIDDTLVDLANYTIMLLVELRLKRPAFAG